MTCATGLRKVVVVCLCVIGCFLMTQGKVRTIPGFPPFQAGFCPPGSHPFANDVQTSNVGGYGNVQIEECVTTDLAVGGTHVDRYGYRVTNNCSSVHVCEFSLPNNTGSNSPCYTNLGNWTCIGTVDYNTGLPNGWKWAAQLPPASSEEGIDPGGSGDFWIDVPTGTAVDDEVTGHVMAYPSLNTDEVTTTGPTSPLPDLRFTADNPDQPYLGHCVYHEGGMCEATVTATVENFGNSSSVECFAEVTNANGVSSNCVPSSSQHVVQTVPILMPNQTAPITWTWTFPCSGNCLPCVLPQVGVFGCVLTLKVDYSNLVTESDDNNNSATGRLCCQ